VDPVDVWLCERVCIGPCIVSFLSNCISLLGFDPSTPMDWFPHWIGFSFVPLSFVSIRYGLYGFCLSGIELLGL
jgi:hypothetical protein